MSDTLRPYHLLLIEEGTKMRVAHLNAATYSIGRDRSDSVRLSDPSVSRNHAVMLRVPSGQHGYSYRIFDGNSRGKPSKNGLYINGLRRESKQLEENDVIKIGSQVYLTYYVEMFTEAEFSLYCYGKALEFQGIQEAVFHPTVTLYPELVSA